MNWIIEARNKRHGAEWEPLAIKGVTATLADGSPERKFAYDTAAQAVAALKKFLTSNNTLAHVIVRAASGGPRFLDMFELRFTRLGDSIPAEQRPELAEVFAYQTELEAERRKEIKAERKRRAERTDAR